MKGGAMSRRFDIRELVRVAIIDERSGEQLYRSMSGRAQDKGLQAEFSQLAEKEKEHQRRFEKMLEGLKDLPDSEQYPDEYVDYLEALVAGGGQSEAGRGIEDMTSDVQLVSLAMRFEREQLALQRDISEFLGDRHKEVIEPIINEERDHLVQLSRAKTRLQS
jgi:rubrerythrin